MGWWGLLATRGRSRRFGITFEGLCCTLGHNSWSNVEHAQKEDIPRHSNNVEKVNNVYNLKTGDKYTPMHFVLFEEAKIMILFDN